MKLGFAIPHEIRIRASANMGFIVKIGCGEFVTVNQHVLLDNLGEYFRDPEKWEKEYNNLPGRTSGKEVPVPSHTSDLRNPASNETTDEARG